MITMQTLTAQIIQVSKNETADRTGGYVILWSDGHYESQADDQTNIRSAQLFANHVEVWRYLESSYPAHGPFRGQWLSEGTTEQFCITVGHYEVTE